MTLDSCPRCGEGHRGIGCADMPERPQPFLPSEASVQIATKDERIADLTAEVAALRALIVRLGHSSALAELWMLRGENR